MKTIMAIASVAFVLMLITAGAAQSIDASPTEASENYAPVNDDTIPTVNISAPLVFNKTDGAASVSVINTAAGKEVCSYKDGTLGFTKSVKLKLTDTINNDNLITFNANSDQTISVNDGVTVNIECDYQYVNITENKDYAVINCDSSLKFTGSGQLKIELTKNSTAAGQYKWDIVYAKVNVNFDNNKLEFNNKDGYGVVYSGQDLNFNSCNMTCRSTGHVFYCKNTNTNNFKFNVCNIKAYSSEKAFKLSGDYSSSSTLVTKYGSNGNDPVKEIEGSKDFYDYDNVEMVATELPAIDGNTIMIIVAVIIVIAVIALIIYLSCRKTRMLNANSQRDPAYYGPQPSSNKEYDYPSNDDKNDYKSDYKNDYKNTVADEPPLSDDSVRVAISTTLSNVSFVLQIDGTTIGNFDSNWSTFDIPKGMHEIRITTNDMNGKEIIKEKFIFFKSMELTVKKSVIGYSLEKR